MPAGQVEKWKEAYNSQSVPRSDRLFALANLLAGPKRRRLEELARELCTSPRSIYRDLADLEGRGIPVERVNGTYRLMDGATMRPLQLTPRDRLLLTLCLENPALEQPAFTSAMRQLRAKLSSAREDGSVAVLSGPDRTGEVPPRVIDALEEAIRNSHSISILYTSLTSGEPRWRGVDPWSMFHRSEAWYLVGRCHQRDEPRTFRMDRIGDVLPIGQSFVRPEDFNIEQWLSGSWGVLESDDSHEAVVLFDAAIAPFIEHAQHHPSESKHRLDDGHLEYRVRVSCLDELARWIVGFGGKARVTEPESLIRQVQEIASGAAAAHDVEKSTRIAAKRISVPSARRNRRSVPHN